MKPAGTFPSTLPSILALSGSALLLVSQSQAAFHYWDTNGTNTTGFTALPPVVNTGGTLGVTWTKAAT